MAVFTIETPSGKRLKIEAADQATAIRGAQEWEAGQQSWMDKPTGDDAAPEPMSKAGKEFADFASGATQNPAYAQYEQLPAWKKPLVAGSDIATMVANGATFGFGDKAIAGVRSLFTGKSYADELAEQRRQTEGSRRRSGLAGTAAELAGGVRALGPLAARGFTATRFAGAAAPGLPRLAALTGGAAADGAVIGGVSALGNDSDVATGVATGALIGGITPGALAILRNTFAPLFARLAPNRAANAAIENLVARSGRTPQQIVQDLETAAREGQGGSYTVADALGNPGQRMLSTVARTPGDARRQVVEALEQRQAGQGRRISRFLEEGFGTPQTAAQTETARTAARRASGNLNYGDARAQAGAVDTSRAIQELDQIVRPGVTPLIGTGAADNGVYATLSRMRALLGRGNTQVSDFDRAFMAKQEMDAIIEQGGVAANLLRPARNALDEALETASAPYANARNSYRQASREIDAVDIGRNAARRGRVEDTIPQFQGMTAGEQSGFRAGYVDPLIEATQGAAVGVNKARPLINDATAAEFPVFAAPGRGAQLQRQLGREQTMFETRNHALGGSRTADNLADQAEMSLIDPTILGNIVTGNWGAAAASLGRQSIANLQGLAPSVRNRIATFLLERVPNAAGQRMADALMQGRRLTQREAANLRVLMLLAVQGGNQVRGQ